MFKSYDHELSTIQSAVREAGHRVLQLAKDGFETHVKADQSPVTTADLEVDQRLKEILLNSFPEDGWLSEETPDDGKRLNHARVWVHENCQLVVRCGPNLDGLIVQGGTFPTDG